MPDIGHILSGVGQMALIWLPLLMFGMIIYLLWRTLQVMPRVKPKHVHATSKSSVTWDEVAGLEEARAEMQEIVDFLRDSKRFARLGARVPKGILLYGPPGTGKTLLAKAVAHESGANFYSQSASAFVEMFAGLGAARIRKLFEQARKDAPAIVFIDELDAVGSARTGHGFNREQDQTLNQLLVELDGFNNRDQVVVMAASNRLQDLDTALLRPGRFDRQVLDSLPDLARCEEILIVDPRGKPLAAEVDLAVIARQTACLTGADLANTANEAAIFAGRENKQYIHHVHFDSAMERIIAGLQQRRVMSEKEKRILAYHEGGHALMSQLMGGGFPVQKATIVPRGGALGYTFNLPDEERYLHTREEYVDWMKTALARAMVFEYGMSEGIVSRTMRADNYALSEETKRVRDQEQARLTDDAYEEAVRLITKHRSALDRLAHALLEKETLVRDEILALLGDLEPESQSSETVGRVVQLKSVEEDAEQPDPRTPDSR